MRQRARVSSTPPAIGSASGPFINEQNAHDGDRILGEFSAGSLVTASIPGLAADEYLARVTAASTTTALADDLGTVRAIADASGALTNVLNYEPFGVPQVGSAATIDPHGFTGREQETDTLMFYRARYYDAASGRFISEDPLGLRAGVNPYVYALDNPLTYTDPSGLTVKGAAGILADVLGWLSGTIPNTVYGPNDARTSDLRGTPAIKDIRRQYVAAGCKSKQYCADYQYRQLLTTNNIVGQVIGGLCADMTNMGGGNVHVLAKNTWGLESGSRLPGTSNRKHPSVQQMIFNGAALQYPKSLLENRGSPGMMQNVTISFYWNEHLPCRCGQ